MSDLRSRAEGVRARIELMSSAAEGDPTPLDDVPLFIEYQAGDQPVADTWTGFVLEVLRRFLGGGPWDNPDLRHNLVLYRIGLQDKVDSTDEDNEDLLQECLDVLDGISDEVYGQ